ncbi:MAG: UDP-N-acetylmuramate--L-alanine ligase, partial [Kiritimatiellae bacterium]|nr:UDP-N-acetylmuramate--L-alanine ligase [Kiritimatiellia bacterium]
MNNKNNKDLSLLSGILEDPSGLVHFVGICGVGMAGLALLLKEAGFRVTGCDIVRNSLADWLETNGIEVLSGHDPEHIQMDVKAVICSSAIPEDDVELARARELGVNVFLRGEVLAQMTGAGSIAVGGTHGKTTTTAFVVQLLRNAGRKPSWCIGGDCEALTGVAGSGDDDTFVVEADESDGTIALYHPDIAVITNVEFDHMEHFDDEEAFKDCFRSFVKNTARKVICCIDDSGEGEGLRAETGGLNENGDGGEWLAGRFLSYGFSEGADVRAVLQEEGSSSIRFRLFCFNEDCGDMFLSLPGRHNVLNALAAVSVGLVMGLDCAEIRSGIQSLSLPRRRFERIVDQHDILVVSDYAHHPSEVAALVQTARGFDARRLIAVFQPHRYTRTLALGTKFPSAFAGINKLILLPVYPASEQPLVGGSMLDLYSHFRTVQSSGADKTCDQVITASSLEQCRAYLRHELNKGDILLVIGAGDVEKIAEWAKEDFSVPDLERKYPAELEVALADLATQIPDLKISRDEPLAGKTTLNVGGTADIWMVIDSEDDLQKVLSWSAESDLPFRILGAGSNILIGDLGVRGVTVRLVGEGFRQIELGSLDKEHPITVKVGAGASIAGLLDWCEKNSLTGLEFLEGIPGTAGGALRMNAGIPGDEICAHVSWIRCLNNDGTECIVHGTELEWTYRSCGSLDRRIVVEAELVLDRGDKKEIHALRESARKRRRWMKGLRSAGSVF